MAIRSQTSTSVDASTCVDDSSVCTEPPRSPFSLTTRSQHENMPDTSTNENDSYKNIENQNIKHNKAFY